MSNLQIIEFERVASKARLSPYARFYGTNPDKVIAGYLWNVELCEALYPVFHSCEVGLRNGINEALTFHHNSPEWILKPGNLELRDRKTIKSVRRQLKDRGRTVTADNVLSSLTFGFWSTLFSGPYEARYWRKAGMLRSVFPHAPRSELSASKIHTKLNRLREFRNRVFHHEPIWQRQDLQSVYGEFRSTSQWISKDWQNILDRVDRFESVRVTGPRD